MSGIDLNFNKMLYYEYNIFLCYFIAQCRVLNSVVVIESGVGRKELRIPPFTYCVGHTKLSHAKTIQLSAIVKFTVHNAIDNKYIKFAQKSLQSCT